MRPINPNKPTSYGERTRMPSPEMVKVFFDSFHPTEYKYKLLFGTQIATGLRIGEVVAINISDFIYSEEYADMEFKEVQALRHDYIKLHAFMNELMKNDFKKFRVNLEKKIKENVIVDMALPESMASLLKEYVMKNLNWIMRMGGFIFCKNNNRQPLYISGSHAVDFMSKKRTQIHEVRPDLGFKDVIKKVVYEKDYGWHKGKKQNLYRFGTHSFRKFHALMGYIFDGKDPVFAKELLHHVKQVTTDKHYLNNFDFKEKREVYQDKVFGPAFHDIIRENDSKAVAVWDEIKN